MKKITVATQICLILGIVFMLTSPATYFIYIPLLIASFILSIILLSRGAAWTGTVMLLSTIILPLFIRFVLVNYGSSDEMNTAKAEMDKQEQVREEEIPSTEEQNEEATSIEKRKNVSGQDVMTIPEYSIIHTESLLPYKVSWDLRINKRYSKEELNTIRKVLIKRSEGANKVFISFFLPGMQLGAGAWAIAHSGEEVQIMEYMLNVNPTTLKE